MLYFKFLHPIITGDPKLKKDFIQTPLPLLVVQFFLTGVISILLGVVADMVMRTYYEAQSKTTYVLDNRRRPPPRDGKISES
jgi:hypothetical protein